MGVLRRLARALQQDRIRASAEEHALLRLRPGDFVEVGERIHVVRAVEPRADGLAYRLEPEGRLVVGLDGRPADGAEVVAFPAGFPETGNPPTPPGSRDRGTGGRFAVSANWGRSR
jgi:hypothetical protein